MALKVWQMFTLGEGFSNAPFEALADIYYVAARSRRDAYYLAYAMTWAGGPDAPEGVVQVTMHRKGQGWVHRSWCGCALARALNVHHGDGRRTITASMQAHVNAHHHADWGVSTRQSQVSLSCA